MKVLIISSWWPTALYPGAGSFVVDQFRAIQELCQVSVMHLTPPLEFLRTRAKSPDLHLDSSCITPCRMPFWAIKQLKYTAMPQSFLREAEEHVKKYGMPDIIHCHVTIGAGMAGVILGERWKRPVVITEHTGPFRSILTNNRRNAIISTLNRADACVAVSPFQAECMKSEGVDRPIQVIGNVVDNHNNGIEVCSLHSPLRLFSIGQPSQLKGTHLMLEALSIYKKQGGIFSLRIAGGPVDIQWIELAAKHGLSNHITFLGFLDREKIAKELAACDVMVHCAQAETFCIAIAEAMLAGKPVVTTPCGGPEWFIGEHGIVSKSFSPIDIMNAIKSVDGFMSNYDPLAASREIAYNFSSGSIGMKLIDLYRETSAKYDS
jgi:glycosyltransferase involved in cell wall biosynthesis